MGLLRLDRSTELCKPTQAAMDKMLIFYETVHLKSLSIVTIYLKIMLDEKKMLRIVFFFITTLKSQNH